MSLQSPASKFYKASINVDRYPEGTYSLVSEDINRDGCCGKLAPTSPICNIGNLTVLEDGMESFLLTLASPRMEWLLFDMMRLVKVVTKASEGVIPTEAEGKLTISAVTVDFD